MNRLEIKKIMDRYCEPAILLHRPFPPIDPGMTQSRLGGLPRLPQGVEWPRTAAGVPLHFLAEIHSKDLPAMGPLMPDEGVFFFFALIGESADVFEDRSQGASRVLFVPSRGEEMVPPPSDIPRIDGGYSRYERYFCLEGEPGFTVYPSWPVVGVPIRSWPDPWALPENVIDLMNDNFAPYDDMLWLARSSEILLATGKPILPSTLQSEKMWQFGRILATSKDKEHIVLPRFGRDRSFSWVWRFIDRTSRYIRNISHERLEFRTKKYVSSYDSLKPDEKEKQIDDLRIIQSQAEDWIREASRHRQEAPVDSSETARFETWLIDVLKMESNIARHIIPLAIDDSLRDVMNFLWKRREEDGLDLDGVFEHFDIRYSQMTCSTIKKSKPIPGILEAREDLNIRGSWSFSCSAHQMLGHASRSQTQRPVAGNEVLLLHLESDQALEFSFGDGGEIEFLIDKDDLDARRFDRAWAILECT